MTSAAPAHPVDEILGAFAVAVRAAGVPVTMDRTTTFLRGCATVGVGDEAAVYWTGRATLCGTREDLDRYDHVFGAWFAGTGLAPTSSREPLRRTAQADLGAGDGEGGSGEETDIRVSASRTEVLRQRDIATMSPADRAELAQLFNLLRPTPPQRTSPRRRPSRRGEIDARRTLRDQLRRGASPAQRGRHEDVDVDDDLHRQLSAGAALPAVCGNLVKSDRHRLVLLKVVPLPEPVEHTRAEISPDSRLNDLVLRPAGTSCLAANGVEYLAIKLEGRALRHVSSLPPLWASRTTRSTPLGGFLRTVCGLLRTPPPKTAGHSPVLARCRSRA